MDSGPPGGCGELTAAATASGKPRWSSECKVYTRKYHRKNPKPPPDHNPKPSPQTLTPPAAPTPKPPYPPPPAPEATTPAAAVPPPAPAAPSSPSPPAPAPPTDTTTAAAAASEDASSGHNRNSGAGAGTVVVRTADAARKRKARRELRRRFASELDQVRTLSKRLEVTAEVLAVASSAPSRPHFPLPPPPAQLENAYVHSQFSATGPPTPIPPVAAVTPARSLQRRPLTVSVIPMESFEKEKRTPKANQYYHNSEFLLAKDKFPPADSHGHKKSKNHKNHHSLAADAADFAVGQRLYSHPFKKCASLLARLMKHKYGWVFNKAVDPIALGLHDYFVIIKRPMDLGTIKGQLNRGQYRNPREFAEDVRLTFQNAMTYNPKGHDVHVMAEHLSGIFEAQWPEIEAEVEYLASCPPLLKKFPPPPIDLHALERSDFTIHHRPLDSKSRPISHTPPYSARTPSLKKPKAKDPDKRDMTLEEKRKLSNNLQNLPLERLNVVVQIIKNKNLSVDQNDDEIEVDIDSMDAETLWELDRFVTNYRKNLSKHKRKAELATLARQEAEIHARQAAQHRSQEPNVGESPKQNVMAEEPLATSIPAEDGNNGGNISRSSSSASSSGDSGSSSSDSDSDSSSGDGSDATKSS